MNEDQELRRQFAEVYERDVAAVYTHRQRQPNGAFMRRA